MKRYTIVFVCGLLGCQSASDLATPAIIAGEPGNALEEIGGVISSALGANIRLSEKAFSESSLVTLEHGSHQTITGQSATGMSTEKPEQFRLVLTTAGCALVRLKTGEVLPLQRTRCRNPYLHR